jgi:hypothetical protein
MTHDPGLPWACGIASKRVGGALEPAGVQAAYWCGAARRWADHFFQLSIASLTEVVLTRRLAPRGEAGKAA